MTRKFFPRKDAVELSKIYNLLSKKDKTTVGFFCLCDHQSSLRQVVFKVAALCLMQGWKWVQNCLPNCHVNHTLVKLVPCRHNALAQLISVIDAMLADLFLHHWTDITVYRIQVQTVRWPEPGRSKVQHCGFQELDCLTSPMHWWWVMTWLWVSLSVRSEVHIVCGWSSWYQCIPKTPIISCLS